MVTTGTNLFQRWMQKNSKLNKTEPCARPGARPGARHNTKQNSNRGCYLTESGHFKSFSRSPWSLAPDASIRDVQKPSEPSTLIDKGIQSDLRGIAN